MTKTAVRTYKSLSSAKAIATKRTKAEGQQYIPVGPSAVDGTYAVELFVPAPAPVFAKSEKRLPGGGLGQAVKYIRSRATSDTPLQIRTVGKKTWIFANETPVYWAYTTARAQQIAALV